MSLKFYRTCRDSTLDGRFPVDNYLERNPVIKSFTRLRSKTWVDIQPKYTNGYKIDDGSVSIRQWKMKICHTTHELIPSDKSVNSPRTKSISVLPLLYSMRNSVMKDSVDPVDYF